MRAGRWLVATRILTTLSCASPARKEGLQSAQAEDAGHGDDDATVPHTCSTQSPCDAGGSDDDDECEPTSASPCPDGVLVGNYWINDCHPLSAILDCSTITGSLGFASESESELSLPALRTVGAIEINDYTGLVGTVSLPALTTITDNFSMQSRWVKSLSLPSLSSVGGDFVVHKSPVRDVSLPLLVKVGGSLRFRGLPSTNLSLPLLEAVGGDLMVNNTGIDNLGLPALTTVGKDVLIAYNDRMTSMELPLLAMIHGGLRVEHNTTLPILSLPLLTSLGTNPPGMSPLVVSDNRSLRDLALPSLTTIYGDFSIQDNVALPTEKAEALLGQIKELTGSSTIQGNL